jgi:thiamine-phosphate pyrophosphorylase
MQLPLYGLYAITDDQLLATKEKMLELVEQAILGGAQLIQYRDKSNDLVQRLEKARALRHLCHQHEIPLIINDNLALAQQIGADGVHLGKDDINPPTARALLGKEAIIGVSCYNQLELAKKALKEGATYVAFGSFYPSMTKPEAVSCSIDLLQEASKTLSCPIAAIGGITPENGAQLIQAGADILAVVQGIFGQTDVMAAAKRYAELF